MKNGGLYAGVEGNKQPWRELCHREAKEHDEAGQQTRINKGGRREVKVTGRGSRERRKRGETIVRNRQEST